MDDDRPAPRKQCPHRRDRLPRLLRPVVSDHERSTRRGAYGVLAHDEHGSVCDPNHGVSDATERSDGSIGTQDDSLGRHFTGERCEVEPHALLAVARQSACFPACIPCVRGPASSRRKRCRLSDLAQAYR